MNELVSLLSVALKAISVWEAIAVILGVAYLLLAMKEKILCWYAAFFSTLLSIYIFWDVNLLMESALQIYYLVMAVYGWYQWKYSARDKGYLPITTWSMPTHLMAITGIIGVAGISGYLLANNTQAAWPYLDSFTTWGSIVTTYMVAKKVLENWVYWLFIDSVSIFLYFDRELYLYALLFMVYIVIVIFGLITWIRHYQNQGKSLQANLKGYA